MKLNPDCIRDILLTAEEVCDFSTVWEYDRYNSTIDRLHQYSHDEIIYHISQCHRSKLLENVQYYDSGDLLMIPDLTPEGHKFLADVQSDNVWNDVKEVSKKVGSNSLNTLSQIATSIISTIVKSQLGLT